MEIQGLDYNTKRSKLVLPEYGREVQLMVEHAITLPTKEERQLCAETIISTMKQIAPMSISEPGAETKYWNHIAIMSNFQLDIDYPCDIEGAKALHNRPTPLAYPMSNIPMRHYGKLLFETFDRLKTMEPGEERDALVALTANQMKRMLMTWGRGSCENEKVADDLAMLTDGVIQLDLDTFVFDKIQATAIESKKKKRK